MKTSDLLKRVNQLLDQGEAVLATEYKAKRDFEYWDYYVDFDAIKGLRTAALSFIQRVYGNEHPHFKEFDTTIGNHYINDAKAAISILRVVKDEIEGGWLFTLRGLITSEVFSNFLEMAEHFLIQGYKDPAAVMAGSVLEEHLRQLCNINGVATEVEKADKMIPKKADQINSDLTKAEVYNKLDQKAVTNWLAIRNRSAHGKYDEYTDDQVKLMLQGIIDFMTRVPV
jgi:hypothetical protein